METDNKRLNYIIPLGDSYAKLPTLLTPLLAIKFRNCKTKLAFPILVYIIEQTQYANLYNASNEIIGVEVSRRYLANIFKVSNDKTISNTLKWLENEGWITLEKRRSATTVAILKLSSVFDVLNNAQPIKLIKNKIDDEHYYKETLRFDKRTEKEIIEPFLKATKKVGKSIKLPTVGKSMKLPKGG